MSCSKYQDELILSLGQDALPEELNAHLAECPNCRAFWRELNAVGANLGKDEWFLIGEARVEQLSAKVEETIRSREREKGWIIPVAKRFWYDYAPVAAAAVLVVGITIGTLLSNREAFDDEFAEIPEAGTYMAESPAGDTEEPDNGTIGTLIYDYATEHSFDASEWLLDDLTDEELEYLEENFHVGDLL